MTNGLKARMNAKQADGTALTVTTQENVIKKTLDKIFAIPSDLDCFKYPVYPYGLKEHLFIRIELNSAKIVLCVRGKLMQYTKFPIFFLNMMRFLTTHMPQA